MSSLYSVFNTVLNKHRRLILMCVDAAIAVLSYLIAFSMSGMTVINQNYYFGIVFFYAVVYVGVFSISKMYASMWRYAGVEDLFRCMLSSILASLIFIGIATFVFTDIRIRTHIMVLVFSAFGSCGLRMVYRALIIIARRQVVSETKHINTMFIGAGQATLVILNELQTNNPDNYDVKCIVDDDESKIGRAINSVPIVSSTEDIYKLVDKFDIQVIIFAIPSIDNNNKHRILEICSRTNCKLKILPDIYSILEDNKKNLVSKIRDVQIEDLLGRQSIKLDCSMTEHQISGKTVLVTGGGGSIGSELCRQIAAYKPKKLIILDIYENNAYEIQQELIRMYGDKLNLRVEIASIRDREKLEQIFTVNHIQIVFHAAAHKHVPLMETNPEEAIKNNVIGTYNVADMANKYYVEKFVLISTDKAVNPTSVMGATKRIAEMIIQSFSLHSATEYVAVRFGNVLGSNGSVIPLFLNQIHNGGPVTVTDERITRYFMTIPEAVQLVLKASSMAKGGEIFVLDMGEPVKIKDLAYNLIKLSGLEPNVDVKIEYTGLRPGEKLYEELLITKSPEQKKTSVDKIFIEEPKFIDEKELYSIMRKLDTAAHKLEVEQIIELIEQIVPTYIHTTNSCDTVKRKIAMTEEKESMVG